MRHELFLPQLSGRTASYFCRGRQLLEQAGSTLLTAAFSFAPRPTDRRRRHSFILVYGCRQPYETAPPPQLRRTLGQNHKKLSKALLGPFVLKKGANRGIKCQFDILEKNLEGDPSMVKNSSPPFLLKLHVSVPKGKSILHAKFEQNQRQIF